MKKIEMGIISYRLIYIFIPILANGIRFGMIMMLSVETQTPLSLTLLFVNSIAELLAGLPFVYLFIKTLNLKSKKQLIKQQILIEQKLQFQVVVNQTTKSSQIWGIFMIIASSLMGFIYFIIGIYFIQKYSILKIDSQQYTSILDLELIPISIFYYCILEYYTLHYPIFKHQIYSLIIILIGFCMCLFANIKHETHLDLRIPILCLCYLLTSTQYVSHKWLMQNKYYTIYELLFYKGAISIILCLIPGWICFPLLS